LRLLSCLFFGVVITGCQPPPQPFEEAVNLRELMLHVVEPAAEIYWDSVGTIMDVEGTHYIAPTTPDEWIAVENAAATLAEAGNLLLIPARRREDPRWQEYAAAMLESGRQALAAADSRDVDAVFVAGGDVYVVCADCHAAFAPALLPVNFQQAQ
jgi:hypothetical protein